MASIASHVRCLTRLNARNCPVWNVYRHSNTLQHGLVEKHRKSNLAHDKEQADEIHGEPAPPDYRYVYPDFLPDPTWYKRDRIVEKLTMNDMVKRRENFDIPEFYVGTVMAVTVSDPHASGKKSRFVGICIQRSGSGLRSTFTLRNHIDGQGLEVLYDLYNPTVLKIDVLKLEKRLDEELFYLRDCAPDCSTIPFNFDAVPHPPGAPVPVNNVKVKIGPRPWHERWDRKELRGVEDLELPEKFYKRAEEVAKPWEKHDIMKKYRESINDDEADSIMAHVQKEMTEVKKKRRQALRKEKGSS